MNVQLNSLISVNQMNKETLDSFNAKNTNYTISKEAMFKGFNQRIKIESLKSFVV